MSPEGTALISPSAPAELAASKPENRAYPAPAITPTQLGPRDLRYDFNDGCIYARLNKPSKFR